MSTIHRKLESNVKVKRLDPDYRKVILCLNVDPSNSEV